MIAKKQVALSVAAVLCLVSPLSQASDIGDLTNYLQIDGQIRSFYFNRLYNSTTMGNQSSFSIGGMLNIKTKPFLGGFSAGVSFFTANDLGANSHAPAFSGKGYYGGAAQTQTDTTLMGASSSINALGQAYLEYAIPKVLSVKVGDQEMNTPWLGQSDGRLLVNTYQGVFAQYSPISDVTFYGLREFRYKSRTSDDYYRDNAYYGAGADAALATTNALGDTIWGGNGTLGKSTTPTSGTLAFGARAAAYGAKASLWYYDFYQFTNMFYGNASYTLKTGLGIDPLVGVQFMREWDNNSLLNGTNPDGGLSPKGSSVNNTTWGVQAGFNYDLMPSVLGKGQLTWSYNQMLNHPSAIGGGAAISPFTVGYATDPLYTTDMIRGLVETGPGNAWKVKLTQNLLHKEFLFIAAVGKIDSYYNGNSTYTYADLTYFPRFLKGFSIRNRTELSTGNVNAQNGSGNSFIYERLMLTYAF